MAAVRGTTATGLRTTDGEPALYRALDRADQGVGDAEHLPVALALQLLRLGVVLGGVGIDLADQVGVVLRDGFGERLQGARCGRCR
jgi:hypothetical protein